jgi:hypothetical protein
MSKIQSQVDLDNNSLKSFKTVANFVIKDVGDTIKQQQ